MRLLGKYWYLIIIFVLIGLAVPLGLYLKDNIGAILPPKEPVKYETGVEFTRLYIVTKWDSVNGLLYASRDWENKNQVFEINPPQTRILLRTENSGVVKDIFLTGRTNLWDTAFCEGISVKVTFVGSESGVLKAKEIRTTGEGSCSEN